MDAEKVDKYFDIVKGRGETARFDDDELRQLLAACEEKLLQPKQPLWVADDVRTAAYILAEGRLERTTRTHSGRIHEQYSEPGTMLSLSALIKPWPYHSTLYAEERSTVLALSRAKFVEMFDARDHVAYKLVDAIGEYLVADMRNANERLQEVFGHPAETLMMLRRRIREDSKA
jgi:CRP-like cAMP-binding protein